MQHGCLLDGLPYEEWKHPERERPKRMEIEVVVNSLADGERKLLLPALIHVDSESINEPTFVAVANSPWDGDSQPGPFSVTDFLMWATFSSSDEFGECDSWETQREEYQRVIESTVNEYFGGPRAALLTLLRDAIPWDAHAYLDRRVSMRSGSQEARAGETGRSSFIRQPLRRRPGRLRCPCGCGHRLAAPTKDADGALDDKLEGAEGHEPTLANRAEFLSDPRRSHSNSAL